MSAFDTARELRMPGIVIERAYLDPRQLSTRMKNAIKKMLRRGYTEGGWGSKSKQVAQKLAESHGLMLVGRNGRGFSVPNRSTYTDEAAAKVLALIDADEALYYMTTDSNENHRNYMKARYNGAREIVRANHAGYGRWVSMDSAELSAQCCEIFASMRTPQMIEKIEAMCDRIDAGEPIDIVVTQ